MNIDQEKVIEASKAIIQVILDFKLNEAESKLVVDATWTCHKRAVAICDRLRDAETSQ